MPNIPSFCPGLSADQAHLALKTSVRIMDQAHHCAVLWFGEIMQRKLYRELGFGSMHAYAVAELGFSLTRAGDFMRLTGKLAELPVLKEEMAAGRLGYTKAREIAAVADSTNEKEWVQEAKTKTRRELVATVKRAKAVAKQTQLANPGQTELLPRPTTAEPAAARSVQVGFDLTPGQYVRYEAMMAKIVHRGGKAQLLLDAMEALLAAEHDNKPDKTSTPRGVIGGRPDHAPHTQIHILQCPDCAGKSVQTPQGEIQLTKAESAAADCDAMIHKPGKRNTSTIPPKTRQEILTRDRHQCRRKGCHHTRYLHIHHIIPRAGGGTNDTENLVTLCSTCHDLWHQKGGDLGKILSVVPVATG